MPVEQRRRVQISRSLATSEQENPSSQRNTMPRSGLRYTGSRPAQPVRRTGDKLHLSAGEFDDYGSATEHLTLIPLNRQIPRARTTSAYPTSSQPQQTRPSAALTARQKPIQDPVTQPAIYRVHWWSRRSWQTQTALVIFGVLLLWTLGVNAYTGFVARISDPITYTQSAHKQEVMVVVDGKMEEAHAFIDLATSHVILLITPDNVSKSRILVGPPVYASDPEQLMLTVKASGTKVTTEILAPRDVIDFVAPRQSTVSWTVDLAQKGGR